MFIFFFSSRRRHTRSLRDWSSDVCSSDLPGCRGVSTTVHERADVRVHDVPLRSAPTYLVWRKRRYRCELSGCDRATFTEHHDEIPPRSRSTRRFRAHLARRARIRPIADVADEERASWWLVWRSVLERCDLPSPDDGVVRRLGIDEAAFRRGLRFHTAFVDLDRRRILDLVPGRTKRSVTDWLDAR